MKGIQMKFIALKSALLIMVITVSGCTSTDSRTPKLASQQTQSNTLESNMSQAPIKPKVEIKKTSNKH